MLQKITEGIYRLKIPMAYNMEAVNSYLIKGKKGYTLIDTGDNTEEAISIWSKVLSEEDIHIEKIVLTHVHPDHVGLIWWFQKQYNVPVWMSKKGYEQLVRIRSLFENGKYFNSYSQYLLNIHGGSKFEDHTIEYYKYQTFDFEPTYLFEENQIINIGDFYYKAIWTPGHSEDHFCFYDEDNKVMITGDHILKSVNTVIVTEKVNSNPLKDYLNSLKKIESYTTIIALPGHGDLILDLPTRINEMKEHYKKRYQTILRHIKLKGSTAYEVGKAIYQNKLANPSFLQTITTMIYMESIGLLKNKKSGKNICFLKK